MSEKEDYNLTPGMMSKYDQMQSQWGNIADAIGYFYQEMRRWGMSEGYAVQFAARFEDQIMILLEQGIRRDHVKKLTEEMLAKTPRPKAE